MGGVIEVDNLWKEYRLGIISHRTLTRDLQTWWARVRGKEDPNSLVGPFSVTNPVISDERYWALQNVSFEVRQGDVLGIIGRNGAGKSTLLKILSQVTAPTKGEVRFRGRIASLLEVGTGFHPELTGRENIYLNGAILGMTRTEIRAVFDEIVDFAAIEAFIDTPVKRYSSGMYVRLAFAVAAHLEPEIMVIDEVLAVGDNAFQKKCLGKMGEVARAGRTVLFVSHNMVAVSNLCNRALYLVDGSLHRAGDVAEIVTTYLNDSMRFSAIPLYDRKDRQGSGIARFHSVELLDSAGRSATTVMCGQHVTIRITLSSRTKEVLKNPVVAIGIDDPTGFRVWHLSNESTSQCISGYDIERDSIDFHIPKLPLVANTYTMVLFLSEDGAVIDWIQNAVSFVVESGDFFGSGRIPPRGQGCFLADYSVAVGTRYV
jgi:lipopolysaccharide transport system ATP-binding protein